MLNNKQKDIQTNYLVYIQYVETINFRFSKQVYQDEPELLFLEIEDMNESLIDSINEYDEMSEFAKEQLISKLKDHLEFIKSYYQEEFNKFDESGFKTLQDYLMYLNNTKVNKTKELDKFINNFTNHNSNIIHTH